jgi:activator of Hsp90 ATPase-like protein
MTSLAFDIYLRATPKRVREVLAEPALVPSWLSGMPVRPAGEEDPRRLTCEWLQTDYLEINGGCASVVRFDFVAMGDVTRLMVNHRGLDPGGSLLKVITPGWPMILSSLKSLVETGEPLGFRLSA